MIVCKYIWCAGLGLTLMGTWAFGGGSVLNEEFKFTPNDGAEFEFFGAATALDNGIIAMGLPNDDDNFAENSGSAYLIDATTGVQLFKLHADDPESNERFGNSIDIDNGVVSIGAFQDDDNGLFSGSAYLFDAATGLQIMKLLPSDGASEDNFGYSIAINNNIVVIGANRDDDDGANSGSAYIFDALTGMQIAKLLPDDGASGDGFGISVAISNNIIGVGAWLDDENGLDAGVAYLFDATTGDQLFKLLPTDGAAGDRFGESVAIDGGIIAIGARLDNDNGAASGSAYLFDAATGLQLMKVLPGDGDSNDQFGNTVSIDGGLLAIGAHQENANGSLSGSGYLFDVDTGAQLVKLIPMDGRPSDFFCESIAINNGTIIVGATGDDDNGSSSGSGYVFMAPVTDCSADITGDGVLDFFDISAFLQAFGINDPVADFTGDGNFDFFDISAFLQAFSTGCP